MTDGEAAAGVINNIVDNLKGSPLVIGLLCLNGLFLGLIAWLNHEASANRHDEMMELMRDCNRPTTYFSPNRGGLEESLQRKDVN